MAPFSRQAVNEGKSKGNSRKEVLDGPLALTEEDPPWWEDSEFMEKVVQGYSIQLAAPRESRGKKTTDHGAVQALLESKPFFSESGEFPIAMDEFPVGSIQDWDGIALVLKTMVAKRGRARYGFFSMSETKQFRILQDIEKAPLDFPPLLVLEAVTGESQSEVNPTFLAEAKALYLKDIVRWVDVVSHGNTLELAAMMTLHSLGLGFDEIISTYERVPGLRAEIDAYRQAEALILGEFMFDFKALVNRYYW